MIRLRKFLGIAAAAVVLGLGSGSAQAQVILNLDTPVNGGIPQGTLTATFTNTAANTVQLTISALGLSSGTQYVPTVLFNLVPSWNFSTNPLTFTYVSGIQAVSINTATNGYNGGNQIKAGLFDVDIDFESSNSGTPPKTRLVPGTTSVYTITGTGLSASSFAATSVADGPDPGGYYAAADVRGIPGAAPSGSIAATSVAAIPEPSSLALSGLVGLLGLGRLAARRLRRPVA